MASKQLESGGVGFDKNCLSHPGAGEVQSKAGRTFCPFLCWMLIDNSISMQPSTYDPRSVPESGELIQNSNWGTEEHL